MSRIKLLLLLLNILFINTMKFTPNFPHTTKTYIHLEKFNERYNLFHIGVSFIEGKSCARYDFHQSQNKKSYLTYSKNLGNIAPLTLLNVRNTFSHQMHQIYPFEFLDSNLKDNIETVTIFWGKSNKSLEEIMNYEKELDLNYIITINDCRHFVRAYTKWVLNKPTPIWRLSYLFEKYKIK